MSQATELMEHYREVRQRLRTPANAVMDIGIDLKRQSAKVIPLFSPRPKPEPSLIAAALDISTPPVTDYPNIIPFRPSKPPFPLILDLVAADFKISCREIRSHERYRYVALPRQIAIWMACKYKSGSLFRLGEYLQMHHTSIMYGRDKITGMMAKDTTFRQKIHLLEDKLLAAFHRTPVPAKH